tara:strand:- start:132 stop:635 length:504 start_codon:yes stop_codon:yes gene_type:complete
MSTYNPNNINYFWQPKKTSVYGCFSNWWYCEFKDSKGFLYQNTEQYMMAKKAELFDDKITHEQIMSNPNPKTCKNLGRRVKGFNNSIWDKNKYQIVLEGCFLKFSQNQFLREKLLSTGSKILVEASPYDKIWGIGLTEEQARQTNPSLWPGQNLLGQCLMEVRSRLL